MITSFKRAAMENVAYDANPELGRVIEAKITHIFNQKYYTGRQLKKPFSDLSKEIKKVCGVNVVLTSTMGHEAYVELLTFDNNHVFSKKGIGQMLRRIHNNGDLTKESRRLFAKKKVIKGTVDLNKGTVSGDLSEIQFKMGIGPGYFGVRSEFTAREITSIILHEIGHTFTYLELLYRHTCTNYFLEEVTRKLAKTDDKKLRYQIYKDARAGGWKEIDDDKMAEANDVAAITYFMKRTVDVATHELGNNPYDLRGAEALADQFMVRMGYGADFVTALKKLQGFGDYKSADHALLLLMSLQLISLLALLALVAPYTIIEVVFVMFIYIYFIGMFVDLDATYDTPSKRFEAVVRGVSRQLKDKSLPSDKVKAILDSLDDMTAEIKEVEKHLPDAYQFQKFQKFVPWKRKGIKLMELQQGLEKMTNNRLWEASQRIQNT